MIFIYIVIIDKEIVRKYSLVCFYKGNFRKKNRLYVFFFKLKVKWFLLYVLLCFLKNILFLFID